ncbi:hypothetical protein [Lentisalinibacter salinarum]|uniref:hypothetical protein n=1 Tax=Lentisalinibacter salinarum TaxID=2992239 RepID=UPI003864D8BA
MRQTEQEFERLLDREFARAFEPVADDGFSERVLRRVRRQGRARVVALTLAGAVGLVVAFVPLVQIASALSEFSPVLTEGWRLSELPAQYRYIVAAALLGLASPLVIRLLER